MTSFTPHQPRSRSSYDIAAPAYMSLVRVNPLALVDLGHHSLEISRGAGKTDEWSSEKIELLEEGGGGLGFLRMGATWEFQVGGVSHASWVLVALADGHACIITVSPAFAEGPI